MNFVMSASKSQIKALLDFYRPLVKISDKDHVEATIQDDKLTITIYHTGKVMYQGKAAEEAFFFWSDHFGMDIPSETRSESSHTSIDYFTESIGSDESGVGDFFGPLTVCAAYVTPAMKDELETLGIKDSKALSDDQIRRIGPKLIKTVTHSLLVLDNPKYNDLILKGYNSNTLKAYLHAQTHKKIAAKVNKDVTVVVDQFCVEKTYMNYLAQFKAPIRPDVFMTKAESFYASVAVASIIARYAFLVHLNKLSAKAGMKLLKGASKHVDLQASKLIKSGGMNTLSKYAKVHFKTTEKAKALLDSNNPTY